MIFVFGSNTAGRHGRGAALYAREHHGAVLGAGVGRTGQSYAIPTKNAYLHTLPVAVIHAHVTVFLAYATAHPELEFHVTRVGCGLAGYTDQDIAPLFDGAPPNCILPDGWPMPPRPPARSYAGIGSRQTPLEILQLMERIAHRLAKAGWTLRSGGADGADTAFAIGAREAGGAAEIYLPWMSFNAVRNGVDASTLPSAEDAVAIASTHHPAWSALQAPVRALMARNAHQVLGASLDDPARMVLCWATGSVMKEGDVVDVAGGTGLAVRLAASRGIPVFNLALDAHRERIAGWLGTNEHVKETQ